jgi:antitoxin HicB
MNKKLDYYLGLPYTIEILQEQPDGWFTAIKELPGCMTNTDTAEEGLAEIQQLKEEWLRIAIEDGVEIPEPRSKDEYSGNFRMRVPSSLHRKLAESAEREGISLNSFCMSALSEAVGKVRAAAHLPNESEREKAIRALLENENIDTNKKDLGVVFADWLRREISYAIQNLQGGDYRDSARQFYGVSRDLKRLRKVDAVLGVMGDLLEQLNIHAEDMFEKSSRQIGQTMVAKSPRSRSLSDIAKGYDDKTDLTEDIVKTLNASARGRKEGL